MPVGIVILAFFVGGFLGSFVMALAAAHDRDETFESMWDEGLGGPLPTGDASTWN